MAAAFPGLQDRLEHLTSAPVIAPADVVEGEKFEDDEAEAPITPVVGDGDDVAERTLPDEFTAVAATELPLCPDAVVFNVVRREFEAVFDVDELINV